MLEKQVAVGFPKGSMGAAALPWGWWLQFLHPPRVRDHPQPKAQWQTQPGHTTSSSSPGVRRGNTCSHSCAPDMMSMLSRRKNLRKRLVRGSLTPLSAGGGVCSSLGGSDAAGSSTGWQLAQSTHCFGWSRLQKPNTQRDPPTSTWAELPQAGQENSPSKEGAAVISPSWALQLY